MHRGSMKCGQVVLWVALAVAVFLPQEPCRAQLSDGAIIVPEFFEEIYRVPSAGGTAVDLLNSPPFERIPGEHLAIADADTAYISYLSDLYRFDFSSGQLAYIDELSFVPRELTMNSNGELIGVATGELFRINTTTGAESSLYDETFFGPMDAVSDENGNLYLAEFFDALGVLSPGGVLTQIGNFADNMFNHLDLGPDGNLYLSTTDGASFYRVNPNTGVGVELDSNVFTFIRDLQVDASGDILFAGEVDARQGVFRFDPTTKALTTVVDDTSVNNGLFNPQDIAIFSTDQEFASADFDEDGDVDSNDLAQLLGGYGSNSTGDVNNDGDTDGADFLSWQTQYTGSGVSTLLTVPEPGSAAILIGLLLAGAWRRIR